jgi:chromosome segregation ATPase
MSHRLKQAIQEEDHEMELSETAQFLNNLRLKFFVGFVSALMVLYSFFGNIYRVPMQLDQLEKDQAVMKASEERVINRVIELEKVLAAKEDLFGEIVRTRQRVEAIERLEASRIAMQQQLDRLEGVTKDVTRLLDNTSSRLTELNANMAALKETTADTKRALEDIKRKAP